MYEGRPGISGRPSLSCGYGFGVACGAQVTSERSSFPVSR